MLNELEMLAKFADKEVTWSLLPFDLVKDGWCVEVVDYIAAMMPANILAIAEAYRALEQRAEAAEAKLVPDGWKLVPIVPTKEMLEEIWLDERFKEVAMKRRYQALLAAAPSPHK